MTDEGKGAVVLSLWVVAFNAGVLLAAADCKGIGFMLMLTATAILVTYLRADARVDAEKRRRKKYEADCAKRAREALKHDKI